MMAGVELERFRHFLPREQRASGAGKYTGWLSNRRMTRRAFAEAAGIPYPTIKAIETRGAKPRPATLAKIYALQKLIGASAQSELLPPNRAAEKMAARRERERDKWLDSMLAKARKPMSKKAQQHDLF
jgi:transcriptional regulator with XRE-family HTH domain